MATKLEEHDKIQPHNQERKSLILLNLGAHCTYYSKLNTKF